MQPSQDTSNTDTNRQFPPVVEIIVFYLGCILIGLIAILLDIGFSIKLLDVPNWEGCEVAGACGLAIMFLLGMLAVLWIGKWSLVEILFLILWTLGYKLKLSFRVLSILTILYFLLVAGILLTITPGLYGSVSAAIIIGLMLGVLHLGWNFVTRFAVNKFAHDYNSSRAVELD